MMRKIFILLAAFWMTGCVVEPAGPVIDAQLNALQGQQANAAFARLGFPIGQDEVAGVKFYFWSSSGVIMQPTTIETTGIAQVGKRTVTYDQTTSGPDQAVPVGCTIRLFVDPRENIISHDYNGNQPGCAPYAQRLNPAYNPRAHFI